MAAKTRVRFADLTLKIRARGFAGRAGKGATAQCAIHMDGAAGHKFRPRTRQSTGP